MTPPPSTAACEPLDPRIRRTRELLQQSLAKLLESTDFDKISVHEIAATATVNRATFYAHYPDKFALLECLIAGRFFALLAARNVVFDGTCAGALIGIILGVCDYLAQSPGVSSERQRQLEPHLESAVVSVVRRMILDGARNSPPASAASGEMLAAATAWAIYGAAKEWLHTPHRPSSEQVAPTILHLVAPLFTGGQPLPNHQLKAQTHQTPATATA